MTTMLDKAAAAVQGQRLWIAHDGVSVFPDEELAKRIARAALQAIREPETGAKILARLRTDGTLDYEADDGAMWAAIITAILEEKPE